MNRNGGHLIRRRRHLLPRPRSRMRDQNLVRLLRSKERRNEAFFLEQHRLLIPHPHHCPFHYQQQHQLPLPPVSMVSLDHLLYYQFLRSTSKICGSLSHSWTQIRFAFPTITNQLLSTQCLPYFGCCCPTLQDGRISTLELRDTLSALGFSSDFSPTDIQHMIHSASDGEFWFLCLKYIMYALSDLLQSNLLVSWGTRGALCLQGRNQ